MVDGSSIYNHLCKLEEEAKNNSKITKFGQTRIFLRYYLFGRRIGTTT